MYITHYILHVISIVFLLFIIIISIIPQDILSFVSSRSQLQNACTIIISYRMPFLKEKVS